MEIAEAQLFRYRILDQDIYYEKSSSCFFLFYPTKEMLRGVDRLPSPQDSLHFLKPTTYIFCIDVSDSCNLRCDYCFNDNMQNKTIDYKLAIDYLEKMFAIPPGGQKYFVDMSGKGEPLLALGDVLKITEWCHQKQNEIRREVLPQFVCNGTLLTPLVVDTLQKNGILFGISLDGDKHIHDLHRRYKTGDATFKTIMANISNIENRQYIGCASTLTKDVFPLLETVVQLSKTFNTLSFRPARGSYGFDLNAEKKWESEYDRLALRLLEDMRKDDNKLFLCLMNGDDYFGKFLCKLFGHSRCYTRCDAGISRFALDLEGRIFPCHSCSSDLNFCFDTENLTSKAASSLEEKINACSNCDFKAICGGECMIELARLRSINVPLCNFRKHLILLAALIEEKAIVENPVFAIALQKFCVEKERRYFEDPRLLKFLECNPSLSFTEAKRQFDTLEKRY